MAEIENTESTQNVEVTSEQADMLKDLLSNWTWAYRSDNEVDCERVMVRVQDVNTYPYISTAPDADIQKPVYDWSKAKWIDKSGETVKELEDAVSALNTTVNGLTSTANDLQTKDTQTTQQLQSAVQMMTTMSANFGQFSSALSTLTQAVQALTSQPTATSESAVDNSTNSENA